jgi:hypothetical protein
VFIVRGESSRIITPKLFFDRNGISHCRGSFCVLDRSEVFSRIPSSKTILERSDHSRNDCVGFELAKMIFRSSLLQISDFDYQF